MAKAARAIIPKRTFPRRGGSCFGKCCACALSGLIRLNLMYAVAWLPAIFVIGRGLLLWYAGLANVADAQMQLEAGEITAEALAEMTQSYTQGMSTIIMQTLLLLVPCLALTGPFTTAWPMVTQQLGARRACVYLVGFHRHGQRQLEIWPADGVHHRHGAAFDVRVRYLLW